jgi:hypothetical protein
VRCPGRAGQLRSRRRRCGSARRWWGPSSPPAGRCGSGLGPARARRSSRGGAGSGRVAGLTGPGRAR